jgi:hypothetical protein
MSQPSKLISNFTTVEVGTSWQAFQVKATANVDEAIAIITAYLGADETPIEASDFRIESVGQSAGP